MKKLLEVRKTGFINNLPGDARSPESFAFPACLTSLMECLGEDIGLETIHAHNREYLNRFAYKEYLAASGMSFGILWHPEQCPSSFDLTQVNANHDDTIRYAFDYAGYGCEIMEKNGENVDEIRSVITESIDAGRPVLGFGIVGTPECSIICGYDDGGKILYGYSHFQSYAPGACLENGMFIASGWETELWKIVLCGEKKEPERSLKPILERGLIIMKKSEIDGYLAGEAAYGAWTNYVSAGTCEGMDDAALKSYYEFHYGFVSNYAEARCYLGNFLYSRAADDEQLQKAAACMNEIHNTCWQVWDVCGGTDAVDGYLCLRDKAKRGELAALIRKMRELDIDAMEALERWIQDNRFTNRP